MREKNILSEDLIHPFYIINMMLIIQYDNVYLLLYNGTWKKDRIEYGRIDRKDSPSDSEKV